MRSAPRRARRRQPDGSFVLSGEKMWITNGGFADLFIVFAKVDGEQFTAFLVERSFPGVSTGQEEHKLGPARLVDDAAPAAGRAGCREPRPRRGRPGSQGRLQRAELRSVQAGRDVQRRGTAGDRRGGRLRGRSAGSSASRSPPSARSGTSSARWRSASTRSRRCSTGPPASSTGCCRAATPATRCSPRSRSSRSKRRSSRSRRARCSTSCSTRTSRFTAATASSGTTRRSGTTATRA